MVSTSTRFLTEAPVKKSQTLRSCLSHALCHLIASMDDISPQVPQTLLQLITLSQVSQCATVNLGTVHDRAIHSLLWSLDCQFDMVPIDRPHIIKSLFKLFTTLDERKILTWEFFANRLFSIFVLNYEMPSAMVWHVQCALPQKLKLCPQL